jgi:hypothetical protein
MLWSGKEPTATCRGSPFRIFALFCPVSRQRPLQPFEHQRLLRCPREDRLDDVGRQQRQPENTTHVALRDVFGVADLADCGLDAVIEHPLPSPCPRKRLDEGAVRLRLRDRRKLAAVRGYDALAAAAALESHGTAGYLR